MQNDSIDFARALVDVVRIVLSEDATAAKACPASLTILLANASRLMREE